MTANKNFYRASAEDFRKIPGSPIAYWVSDVLRDNFNKIKLGDISTAKQGLATGDNERFLRFWHEVSINKISFANDSFEQAKEIPCQWVPYSKGGAYRKWYGNNELIVEWLNGGDTIRFFKDENGNERSRFRAAQYYFKPAITWSLTSSSSFGCRFRKKGYVFDINGMSLFCKNDVQIKNILRLLNSKISNEILKILNPTMAFQIGDISSIPLVGNVIDSPKGASITESLISTSNADWDAYETSWDFKQLPLLRSGKLEVESEELEDEKLPTSHFSLPTRITEVYTSLRTHWLQMTLETQRLETENNRIFIAAYGLESELTPEVPLKEITLTCNPFYRYGVEECEVGSVKWEDVEKRLLEDTMKEFISYAVGCMFGRYSLDKPGLILANQGETVEDYVRIVGSGKWEVRIKGGFDGSEKLSGVDYLAEGDGSGGNDISSNEDFPKRGALRIDQSDSQSSGVDSIQHCGGASSKINSGIQELSIHRSGITSGSRNANHDCPEIELHNSGTDGSNSQSIGRNQKNDILANVETDLTSHSLLPTPHFSFLPDEDNVIPILEGNWFNDDITERFYTFLRVTFGEENFDENLKFIEDAIGKTVRKFFLKDFYNDHIRRYKKRPIYWLFSSPKGSFNALIYMHRYRPDTLSVILNGYLREFRAKLVAHVSQLEATSISSSATAGEKNKAIKEVNDTKKIIEEITVYERDVLYPLATKQIAIDLDDGVKVNYQKFGAALKKIPGLDAEDE